MYIFFFVSQSRSYFRKYRHTVAFGAHIKNYHEDDVLPGGRRGTIDTICPNGRGRK